MRRRLDCLKGVSGGKSAMVHSEVEPAAENGELGFDCNVKGVRLLPAASMVPPNRVMRHEKDADGASHHTFQSARSPLILSRDTMDARALHRARSPQCM